MVLMGSITKDDRCLKNSLCGILLSKALTEER